MALAWKGRDFTNDAHIWATWFDGANFEAMPWQQNDNQSGTSEAPALTVVGSKVVRFWKGVGGINNDPHIYVSTSTTGVDGWSPQQALGGPNGILFGTAQGPAAATVTFPP